MGLAAVAQPRRRGRSAGVSHRRGWPFGDVFSTSGKVVSVPLGVWGAAVAAVCWLMAVFAGAAIVGVSLGLWIALAARPAMPAHPAAAATVVIGLMMHALTAWFGLVVANGGVAIAIVALVMMLGSRPGRRLIPLEGPSEPDGPAQPLSPATSAASG